VEGTKVGGRAPGLRALSIDDIRNVVFLRFRDATKQNGHASVGTLYREPLREIVVCYDNIYKNQKGLRCCYKTFTTSYCCYLMIPCPKCYDQHYSFTLHVEASFVPTLHSSFVNCDVITDIAHCWSHVMNYDVTKCIYWRGPAPLFWKLGGFNPTATNCIFQIQVHRSNQWKMDTPVGDLERGFPVQLKLSVKGKKSQMHLDSSFKP